MLNSSKIIIIFFFSLFFLFTFYSDVQARLVINEVFPNPSGDEKKNEWVELFNDSDTDIRLEGFKLKDKANHELVLDQRYVEGELLVKSKSWLVINRNGHPDFSLNNDEDEIRLYNAQDSDPLDKFVYNDSKEGKSWGRIPDGAEIHGQMLNPSPGYANLAPPTPTPPATPTPKPSPTPKPTQSVPEKSSPTLTPTPAPILKQQPTLTKNSPVLGKAAEDQSLTASTSIDEDGFSTSSDQEESQAEEQAEGKSAINKQKEFLFPTFFSLTGLLLIGIASFPLLKKKMKSLRERKSL